ncbi:LOW QUALITY PROTEIN: tetraspanin-2 [Cinnamomum micranthum f. kanehirae]|uniref:Tetraspanin-2 n=1 Tax=Cinnamomum micranthum f. kanehirae TaxID=337451 RepID=A0A443NGF3_9MAGN|nr:LOW QUALITY PROTEIN: tetraspanin-2 [Cinnamomum micranthum f. kanehirae]
MAVSNTITAVLNFVALMCSIPIIVCGSPPSKTTSASASSGGQWSSSASSSSSSPSPGSSGAFWNRQGLLALYLFAMAALIVLLLSLLIFAFVVTRPDGSYPVYGRGYKEYRFDGFSNWLKTYVGSPENWAKIRTCLSESDFCTKLASNYLTPDQFFQDDISPLQSGCCKPPTVCGYGYVNPTVWVNPSNPGADPDCSLWNNDPSQLCYGCASCKAGLLGNLRKEWRKANVVLIIALVVLIWVYLIACSAFKNAQTEDLFRRYKRGYV